MSVEGLPLRIGPYVVERKLAKGGMGTVLVVRHEKLGVRYALKMITSQSIGSSDQDRFRREVESLAVLTGHPHVVGVHACGVEDGRPWYVMDLVEGASLDDLVRKELLSVAAALRAGLHVARALETAHERGIVHRDLKPGNVLVVGDLEKGGRALLCDFGAALVPGERLTETGAVFGTPAFMAPEQATGDRKSMTPATDVFSLGSVLYYALTGELPYPTQSTSPMGLMHALLTGKLRPPRELRPDIPEAVEELLLRCLERDPARRPPTGAALRGELEALAAGKELSAPRRSRAWVMGALGALVLAGAVLASVARRPGPAPPAAAVEQKPAPPPPTTFDTAPIEKRVDEAFAAPRPDYAAIARAVGEVPASVTSSAAVNRLRARARLAEALAGGRAPQVKALIGDGRSLSPREGYLAANLLVASDPVVAVECALGDRIPDDKDERHDLADLVERAARRANDRVLSLVAAAAARAGLDLGSLRDTVRTERDLRILKNDVDDVTQRLHLVLIASGTRLVDDPANRSPRPLEREELDPHDWTEIGDWNANPGNQSPAPEADELVARARSSIRAGNGPEARSLLERIGGGSAARVDPEQLTLARYELDALDDPSRALVELGPGPDSPARRLSRAAIEARGAVLTGDEHAIKSEALWIEIIDSNRGNYWPLVHAYLSLVRLELKLKRIHHARAWFARGRIALEGGGKAFDAVASELFQKE